MTPPARRACPPHQDQSEILLPPRGRGEVACHPLVRRADVFDVETLAAAILPVSVLVTPLRWRRHIRKAGGLGDALGLEIEVQRLTGKWKLSQNKLAGDRRGAAQALAERGSDAQQALAGAMLDAPPAL